MAKRLIMFSSNILLFIYQSIVFVILMTLLFYTSMAYLNLNGLDFIFFGIPWIIINPIWVYIVCLVGISELGSFAILCLYFKFRFKQLYLNLVQLKLESRKRVKMESIVCFNRMISRQLYELNQICAYLFSLNKFFSFIIINPYSLVPTAPFYLYNLINGDNNSVFITFIFYFAIIASGLNMALMVFMAAYTESGVRKLHPILNSLIYSERINRTVRFKVKSRINVSMNQRFFKIYFSSTLAFILHWENVLSSNRMVLFEFVQNRLANIHGSEKCCLNKWNIFLIFFGSQFYSPSRCLSNLVYFTSY